MTVDLESLAREALEDAKRGTPGPWSSSDFEVYPSEGGPDVSCESGCDGGCDDDERAPIQCARVSHATEVIADVYGLQQFAAEAGRFIAAARTREPLLAQAYLSAIGDRCPDCDDDGLIYIDTHDGEEATMCPTCDGTKSGATSRAIAERDAARQATRDAWAAQHRSHDLLEAMTLKRDEMEAEADRARAEVARLTAENATLRSYRDTGPGLVKRVDELLAERHAICDALQIDNDEDAANPAAAAMRLTDEECERTQERDEARAEVARLTAERDKAVADVLKMAASSIGVQDEREAMHRRAQQAEGDVTRLAAENERLTRALNADPIDDGVEPRWSSDVPWCAEGACPKFDGKRCEVIGARPGSVCEPAVIELTKQRRCRVTDIAMIENLNGETARLTAENERLRVELALASGKEGR